MGCLLKAYKIQQMFESDNLGTMVTTHSTILDYSPHFIKPSHLKAACRDHGGTCLSPRAIGNSHGDNHMKRLAGYECSKDTG